jgi:hypothetical protein
VFLVSVFPRPALRALPWSSDGKCGLRVIVAVTVLLEDGTRVWPDAPAGFGSARPRAGAVVILVRGCRIAAEKDICAGRSEDARLANKVPGPL